MPVNPADFDAVPSDGRTTDPDVPVADRGDMTRLMSDTDLPANGMSSTPPGIGGGHDAPSVDVVEDEPLRTEALDLAAGEMDDEAMTQGRSVVESEYLDRGPAQLDSGVNPDGAADVAVTTDGDVMTGTRGVRAVDDASLPDGGTRRD